jgi:hypothetical protein
MEVAVAVGALLVVNRSFFNPGNAKLKLHEKMQTYQVFVTM